MSKRCPDCGFINDDSRIYCGSCGELLDANLRLIQQLEEATKSSAKATKEPGPKVEDPGTVHKYHKYYDDDKVSKLAQEKKSSPVPWILLGLAAAAVVIVVIALL